MTKKRKVLRQRPSALPRVENPDALPAWIYLEPPPQFNAVELRGGPFFDGLAKLGIRVQRVKGVAEGSGEDGTFEASFHLPWTFLYMNVQGKDLAPMFASLPSRVSVIMDCHYPIMDMEGMIGSAEQQIGAIDTKDVQLANLALADAVTVSQKQWAADLAEVNPNVFYLPDLTVANAEQWGIKMMEIANSAASMRINRLQLRQEMGTDDGAG